MKELSFFSLARTRLKFLGANWYDFGSLFFPRASVCQVPCASKKTIPAVHGPRSRSGGRLRAARKEPEGDRCICMQRSEGDRGRHIVPADWPVNVWEWCEDVYDGSFYSKDGPWHDPLSLAGSEDRVARGGSWLDGAQLCRSARRDRTRPALRDFRLGLRPAVAVR